MESSLPELKGVFTNELETLEGRLSSDVLTINGGDGNIAISKIEDYLYEYKCPVLDYDFANNYFKEKDMNMTSGGCSSVRKGNLYGRNFDWLYDENVEFLVKTDANNALHGVIGLAGQLSKLTREFVESGKYDDAYKVLPFMLTDGINDAGLVCNTNVVPNDKGITIGDGICNLMLPRYILDHFDNVREACDYIKNASVSSIGYEVHIMLADKNDTYVIEFINNEVKIIDIRDYPYMTNFHLYGIERNADGSVYTPGTQDENHNAIVTNKIEEHGQGLERYNIINNGYNNLDIRELMNKLAYTNAYKRSTEPFWYSEYVGGEINVASDTSDFESIIDEYIGHYEERTRDGKTWHTKHSAIYDIDKKELYVKVQEHDEEYTFGFNYYTKEDIDSKLDSKIDDVTVNGTSIVSDGVANVPLANWDGTYGVVRGGGNNATGLSYSEGLVSLSPADSTTFANRNKWNYRPITASNMDDAVRYALTDGKGNAYTEVEKKNARERIGANGGKFELVEEITLEEESNKFERNTEPNGTPYNFDAIFVAIEFQGNQSKGTLTIGTSSKNAFITWEFLQIDVGNWRINNKVFNDYGIVGVENFSGIYGATVNIYRRMSLLNNGIFEPISKLLIQDYTLPINTTIKIYGVRA